MQLIQFFKEVYLAGYVLCFRLSRSRNVNYKAGGAIGFITLVEWLILIGIVLYVQISIRNKFVFPKPLVIFAFITLFFVNQYFLTVRRHGIKFERDFDSLEKRKRITLVLIFAAITVAATVFCICSGIAFRHFIEAH
jgi:hypothetical protein